ncbi:9805_t:CDS:1, partial [Cetraspora pellucida]
VFVVMKKKKTNLLQKKQKINKNDIMLHLFGIKPNLQISQSAISQVYNLIDDDNCGFQLLAIAIFKKE